MQTHVAHKPRRALFSIVLSFPVCGLKKEVRAANLRGLGATEVPAQEETTMVRDREISCAKLRVAMKTMQLSGCARARADDNSGGSLTKLLLMR